MDKLYNRLQLRLLKSCSLRSSGGIVWVTRLYYNGSAAKSHSTTTQYRQLRGLEKLLLNYSSFKIVAHGRCEIRR